MRTLFQRRRDHANGLRLVCNAALRAGFGADDDECQVAKAE